MTKMIIIHPEWDMNVCTKFHVNPPHSHGDISLNRKTVKLMVLLEENEIGDWKTVIGEDKTLTCWLYYSKDQGI